MIYLIAAMSDDGIIGIENKLPWKLRKDLQWFKMNTMGGAVIMGRKTWESLPIKPLENRMNIILSRGMLPKSVGNIYWTNSLDDAFSKACMYHRTYVIGGSEIFHAVLLSGLVVGLLITRVHVNIGRGKSLILPLEKKLVYRSKQQMEKNICYHFEMYLKN